MFTPTSANYTTATATVSLTVLQAAETISLTGLSTTYDGSPKSIGVTTSPDVGLATTVLYNGSATPPTAAGSYSVLATFNNANYSGTASAVFFIAKATPAITWNNPSNITFGTALSGTQLNATAVPSAGTFAYTPPSGTILNGGASQLLSTVFTPTDTANYNSASATATISVTNAAPAITSISPATILVGTSGVNIMINGTGFAPTAIVKFNGASRPTAFITSTLLTVVIPGSDLSTAGSVPITVVNPAPGGGTSAPFNFDVVNPAPIVTSVTPNFATTGDVDTIISVSGVNFVGGSKVQFAGTALATTFVNSLQLTATIPAANLATAGSFAVTVTNPTPGGGVSNGLPFVVKGKIVVTSGAFASPNPAKTGEQITFAAAGVDANGAALTVSWNFGDGTPSTGGASVTHTYVSAQTYVVTATMFDSQGNSITSSTTVTVTAVASVGVMTIKKAGLKGKTPSIGKDSVTILGAVNFPSAVNILSGPLTITVGSVSTTFTLNSKGVGKTGTSTFKFGKPATATTFSAKIISDFSKVLIAAGIPAGGSGKAAIPITITFGNAEYDGTANLTITTKNSTVTGK